MPHYRPLDEATKAKIVRLHREHGVSYLVLAERFRVTSRTIKSVLDEADKARAA